MKRVPYLWSFRSSRKFVWLGYFLSLCWIAESSGSQWNGSQNMLNANMLMDDYASFIWILFIGIMDCIAEIIAGCSQSLWSISMLWFKNCEPYHSAFISCSRWLSTDCSQSRWAWNRSWMLTAIVNHINDIVPNSCEHNRSDWERHQWYGSQWLRALNFIRTISFTNLFSKNHKNNPCSNIHTYTRRL